MAMPAAVVCSASHGSGSVRTLPSARKCCNPAEHLPVLPDTVTVQLTEDLVQYSSTSTGIRTRVLEYTCALNCSHEKIAIVSELQLLTETFGC